MIPGSRPGVLPLNEPQSADGRIRTYHVQGYEPRAYYLLASSTETESIITPPLSWVCAGSDYCTSILVILRGKVVSGTYYRCYTNTCPLRSTTYDVYIQLIEYLGRDGRSNLIQGVSSTS